MSFTDWSTNPANNTLVGAVNWSEGMLPSQVNDSARQMMADLATWRDYLTGASAPYVLKTGGSYTGAISAPSVSASSGDNGRVSITSPSTANTGSVNFQDGSGNRQSYIGSQSLASGSNPLLFHNDVGGGYYFDGGKINSVSGVQWNGQDVWYPGNFTPGNYAPLSGATFTGDIGRDAKFRLVLLGSNPAIAFDDGAAIVYDRTSNKYGFFIGNVRVASIDSGGNIRAIGQIFAEQGSV